MGEGKGKGLNHTLLHRANVSLCAITMIDIQIYLFIINTKPHLYIAISNLKYIPFNGG